MPLIVEITNSILPDRTSSRFIIFTFFTPRIMVRARAGRRKRVGRLMSRVDVARRGIGSTHYI